MLNKKREMKRLAGGALMLIAAAGIAAACGGSAAKSATQSTSIPGNRASSDNAGGRGGQFGNRTPPPALQTSIAQGTPAPFGNGAPPPALQTSIAQGTPAPFGNGAPSGAIATAIAQGTPRSALGGFRGGGELLADVAAILGIDAAQLRSELAAPNASIEKVAAAHGVERPTLRQKLIDAVRQRLDAAVAAGTSTQQTADDEANQFESNLDRTLDEVGGGPGFFADPSATP